MAEGVVQAFASFDWPAPACLLPRAVEAREVIPDTLRARGALVDVVDVYRNVIPDDARVRSCARCGGRGKPDWIAFTSGSTVKNVLVAAGEGALDGVRIACIGPATSKVIRMHGLEISAEAGISNVDGLVQAILEASREPGEPVEIRHLGAVFGVLLIFVR